MPNVKMQKQTKVLKTIKEFNEDNIHTTVIHINSEYRIRESDEPLRKYSRSVQGYKHQLELMDYKEIK